MYKEELLGPRGIGDDARSFFGIFPEVSVSNLTLNLQTGIQGIPRTLRICTPAAFSALGDDL